MMKLFRREDGVAMIFVLAVMAVSVPMITAALGLATTLSIDSRIKNQITHSQYCTLGGSEHALYRLLYDSDYIEGLVSGVEDSYTINCNGESLDISLVKFSDPPDPSPSPADDSRRLQTSKAVSPEIAMPNTLTTFTYTITVENRDDEPESLTTINDVLPDGFGYVGGSTTGVTTDEPGISGQELTWDLSSMGLVLQPGDVVNLIFDAEASVAQDNYCNQAWVEPGGYATRTGQTARIEVGFPPWELCPGPTVKITKTVVAQGYDPPNIVPGDTLVDYTYTISIENTGTSVLSMTRIRDLLPPGFTYTPVSISGNVTNQEPTISMVGGRQQLEWNFPLPLRILSGSFWSKTLVFDAQAQVAPGDYWNEVWVSFLQFTDESGSILPVYTWPTARVQAAGVLDAEAADGDNISRAQIWVGTDFYMVVDADLYQ